jgi:hypothetical protein
MEERFFLPLSRQEFEELKALQRKKRWDWPATFSTNAKGEIWPYVTHGWTRIDDRQDVSGLSSVIDEIARLYINLRSDGGRFFIDDISQIGRSSRCSESICVL